MSFTLVVLAALAAKEAVPMTFEISTPRPVIVSQEPVLVTLRLHNAGPARKLPLAYAESDAVTLLLLDERDQVVAQGDGYTEKLRADLLEERTAPEEQATFELGKGKTMQWEKQLSRALDIPGPGRYRLKARLAFAPAGLALESPAVPLEVKPSHPVWLDALRDQVSPGTPFAVGQHREGEALTTVVHELGPGAPTAFPRSALLPPGDAAGARVAEGDYTAIATHEDQLFRWVASAGGGKLRITPLNQRAVVVDQTFVDGLAPAAKATVVDLAGQAELLGRPVQHADHGLSVLLRRVAPAPGVELRRFDASGGARGAAVPIAALPADPRPVHSAADAAGQWLVAAATGGALPVVLASVARDGKATGKAILGPAELDAIFPARRGSARWQVRGLFLDVKQWAWGRRALLVALTDEAERADAPTVAVVRLPLGEKAAPARGLVLRLAPALASGRDPVAAAVPGQDAASGLHVLATTAAGTVVFAAEGGEAQEVGRVAPQQVALPLLLTAGLNDLYALLPQDGLGIAQRLLKRSGL